MTNEFEKQFKELGIINIEKADDLRNVIVLARDVGEMTFEEISDFLLKTYGIERDKQSVYGMYKRYNDRIERLEEVSDNLETIDVDIVNLYSLGYNMSEIERKLNSNEYKIGYKKIRSTIIESGDRLLKLEQLHITTILNILSKTNRTSEILNQSRESLVYMDVEITDKKLNDLLLKAYTILIKEDIMNRMVSASEVLGIGAVKSLNVQLGTDIDASEVKARIVK